MHSFQDYHSAEAIVRRKKNAEPGAQVISLTLNALKHNILFGRLWKTCGEAFIFWKVCPATQKEGK